MMTSRAELPTACEGPGKCAFMVAWEMEDEPPEIVESMQTAWKIEREQFAAMLGVEPKCTCGTPTMRHNPDCNELRIDDMHDRAYVDYTDAVKNRLHRYWHDTLPDGFMDPNLNVNRP